jgi:hypothetical protein
MQKGVPKEFLKEYETRQHDLEASLNQVASLITLRLSQLAAKTGIRSRIIDSRVKRPAKLWQNASKTGLSILEAFSKIDDILGIRIVCNNISDVQAVIQMIRTGCSIPNVIDIKDMVSSPTSAGYRAIHVRTEIRGHILQKESHYHAKFKLEHLFKMPGLDFLVLTLYGKNVPLNIQKLSQALSTQLSAIDEIAQLIRDDLNKSPITAEMIDDSDHILPQRLALLYEQKFGEIYEWTLVGWVQTLEEGEAATQPLPRLLRRAHVPPAPRLRRPHRLSSGPRCCARAIPTLPTGPLRSSRG